MHCIRKRSVISLLTLFIAGASFSFGAGADIQAPVVSGGDSALVLAHPEIYHAGWIDLNRNGVRDPYEDPAVPIEGRINDLLARMTREERIGQLYQLQMKEETPARDAALIGAGGIGSYLGAAPAPGLRNRIQRIAVEDSRLGIPLIFGFDTIHGFRTVFPIPLALSCAWAPDLLERTQAFAAAESAGAGVDWVFAPMVDIARDPRWGRIAEGSGEDPWLGAKMAAASVRGLQGSQPDQAGRVAACLKHYVGYGAAEGGSDYNTTEIGLPTLRNIYLPPFRAGVEAGAATVMSAFNCLNGVPASANRFTLTHVLRDEWRFGGFVVSDWSAVGELIHHGYAADKAQAAEFALRAGVDMEMVSDCYPSCLPGLLEKGIVAGDVLDTAVRRVLRVKLARGLFERPYATAVSVDSAAGASLAREAVARACVLLKNDRGTLPLAKAGSIALIGPLAADRHNLLGCWYGLGRDEDAVTLQEGLAAAFSGARITTVAGCDLTGGDRSGFDGAVAAAGQADVVIAALGEPSIYSGENSSRSSLDLPGVQTDLFKAVAATGKPVVTVLFAGRPLAVPEVVERSAAVLMAWHPGLQAGNGIADILSGKAGPSGRLTATFPRSIGQVPVHYNHLPTGRTLHPYRDGPRAPLFPFGYGLTYTHFSYGPTRLSAPSIDRAGMLTVTATLTNDGPRAGIEVVQLYLRAYACSAGPRPVRELKGFQRVCLAPGETREVSFTLAANELGCWSPDGVWLVEPGRFAAVVAPDSASGAPVDFVLER